MAAANKRQDRERCHSLHPGVPRADARGTENDGFGGSQQAQRGGAGRYSVWSNSHRRSARPRTRGVRVLWSRSQARRSIAGAAVTAAHRRSRREASFRCMPQAMAGTDLMLRPYAAADEDVAIELWRRSWQHAYPDIDFTARLSWWRERWRAELVPKASITIAERAGEVLGFVTIDPATGYLDQIVVSPEAWGLGVAE